jgi:hypothetical protein
MRIPPAIRCALVTAALACLSSLPAQTASSAPAAQPPKPSDAQAVKTAPAAKPSPAAPAPSLVDSGAYIRRVIVGGTLSFLPLSLMQGGKKSEVYGTPPVSIESQADRKSKYFGAGLRLQAFVTERWAVDVGFIWRRSGYRLTTKVHDTIDNPNTTEDERKLLKTITEETRAHYYDVPLMIRRYNKSRYEAGWRYFYEAGPTLRTVGHIRTAVQEETDTTISCCEETPAVPSKKNLLGATAGAGLILRDDFGIKIIPEVRYTRWFGGAFNTRAATSRRDQVDISISFQF